MKASVHKHLKGNQSRMCDKGVGLGLFLLTRSNPSHTMMKLHILSTYMVLKVYINVLSNSEEFLRKSKKSKNGCFWHFSINLAMFLKSQQYNFDAIAHAEGCKTTAKIYE